MNEAIANVIDHAYLHQDPGMVHLHGWVVAAGPSMTVPAPLPGEPGAVSDPPIAAAARLTSAAQLGPDVDLPLGRLRNVDVRHRSVVIAEPDLDR